MVSKSIWNEYPTTFFFCKRIIATGFSILYVVLGCCILKKSPNSFGKLKWLLFSHLICISVDWSNRAFMVDYYYFVPSFLLRIDGVYGYFLPSQYVFLLSYVTKTISTISCAHIFCHRLFTIMNISRPFKSFFQKLIEVFVYSFVTIVPLLMFIPIVRGIPDQEIAKQNIADHEPIYPDCLFVEEMVVMCDPVVMNCGVKFAKTSIIDFFITSSIIALCSKFAFYLLSKKMTSQSERTKNMHRQFYKKTIAQLVVHILFGALPFIVVDIAMIYEIYVASPIYAVNLFMEYGPTFDLIFMFILYDPYLFFVFFCYKPDSKVGATVAKINSIHTN